MTHTGATLPTLLLPTHDCQQCKNLLSTPLPGLTPHVPLAPPPSQWNTSVEVVRSKHVSAVSSRALHTSLLPSSLNPRDARSASLPRANSLTGTFDAVHRYHAFTRGDATTGWEHSTSLSGVERRQWLQRSDEKASRRSERRCKSVPRYR